MATKNLIASAKSIKNLQKLLNEYFYSTSYMIDNDLNITNNKGAYNKVIAVKKQNRFYLYANMFIQIKNTKV